MEKINPQYYTLDELFQGRLFEIPDYQRAYSWTTRERKDLFNDIEKLYSYNDYKNGDRTHFMATVVCCSKHKKEQHGTDIYEIFDIVDGQQRVTTLIILLKAIAKKLKTLHDPSFRKEMNRLEELLIKDNDNRLILIQANHESALLLRNYLLNGEIVDKSKIKTLADSNLINACIECESFVNKWCDKYNILELLILIRHKLCFIFHELQNESTVYTVFEVLNSRGLEVDWIDKCKSMLMGIAYEDIKQDNAEFSGTIEWLHKYWAFIYSTIGNKKISGEEILKFAATLYSKDTISKILRPDQSIDFFRKQAKQCPTQVVDISKQLLDVASELSRIRSNKKLSTVADIIHARLVYVAIRLSNHFDTNEKSLLIDEWERITFRIFGLYQKDSRTKSGEYTRLAQKIMDIPNEKHYIGSNGRFKQIYRDMVKIGEEYPASGILKALDDADCYNNWSEKARYFFYKYERYLCDKYNQSLRKDIWENIWDCSVKDSIEHIYPQNESIEWKGKVLKRKEFHANRLGNLVILPLKLNSKLQNSGFNIKKQEYKQTALYSAREISKFDDWDIKTIEQRTIELLTWAQKEWDDLKL